MSIYGPKLRLPKIRLPDFSLPDLPLPNIDAKKLTIILIVILLIATILFSMALLNNFGSPISVIWKNNPLYLSEINNFSELTIIIVNNTETTRNITLEVTSDSKEIIIFCPESIFPNVAPEKYRQTTCIIRRNPNEKIFTGTYEILINTNIGKSSTTLEIRK